MSRVCNAAQLSADITIECYKECIEMIQQYDPMYDHSDKNNFVCIMNCKYDCKCAKKGSGNRFTKWKDCLKIRKEQGI